MFDQGYLFHLIDKKSFHSNDLLTTWYYNFRGKRRYILLVEEYRDQIFVVKFYPHSHKNSETKYNVLINDQDASRVIRTGIDVMLHFLKEFPNASFGFIAANTITETFKENKQYTKRFRIYTQLMADFFPVDRFAHISNELNSAYFLVNRCHTDIDAFTGNSLKMFIRNYPDLETEP